MAIVVRIAQKRDTKALLALYEVLFAGSAALQPGYYRAAVGSRSYIAQSLTAPDADLLVAEEDGAVVGFVCVREEHTALYAAIAPLKYALLVDLAVDEGHRRRGVGTALVAAAKAWAAGRGLHHMELEALAENAAALALYQKSGFATARHTLRCTLGPG